MEANPFIKISVHPSFSEAVHLLMDGNIQNIQNIHGPDLQKSIQMD
jgi:hypothetical protein